MLLLLLLLLMLRSRLVVLVIVLGQGTAAQAKAGNCSKKLQETRRFYSLSLAVLRSVGGFSTHR